MNLTEKDIHDFLLANRPEGAAHDVTSCGFCTATASDQEENVSADQKIFTQEQHEQLLASAVEKAVGETTVSTDGEILRLNGQLEEAKTALVERDTAITELNSKIAAREEEDRLNVLTDERVEQVKAVASFSDEQIEARKAGWAKMDPEVFASVLEDYAAVAKAAVEPKSPTTDLPKTSFDGTRQTAGEASTEVGVVERFFSDGLATAAGI